MIGDVSDLTGVLSLIVIRNTENDSKTVIPSDTFSPQPAGNQNRARVVAMMKSVGTMTFNI